MTAGTGVRHSEHNHAPGSVTHFLQIWLLPAAAGLAPGYEQRAFDPADRRGQLQQVAAPIGEADAAQVPLHAYARLWIGQFDGAAESARLALDPARKAYVFVTRGRLAVNGVALAAGDALAAQDEAELRFSDGCGAEVLVFDLAP
jgi:hypothetical protein